MVMRDVRFFAPVFAGGAHPAVHGDPWSACLHPGHPEQHVGADLQCGALADDPPHLGSVNHCHRRGQDHRPLDSVLLCSRCATTSAVF